MNTSLRNREGQLLVDIENGKVLRGDDRPTVTQRWLDSHPFICHRGGLNDPVRYFVGPDAPKAARSITNGGDYLVYEVLTDVSGLVTLQRVLEG